MNEAEIIMHVTQIVREYDPTMRRRVIDKTRDQWEFRVRGAQSRVLIHIDARCVHVVCWNPIRNFNHMIYRTKQLTVDKLKKDVIMCLDENTALINRYNETAQQKRS